MSYAKTTEVLPIQASAPIPRINTRGRSAKYPFDSLEVSTLADGQFIGPWFFVPGTTHQKFASNATAAGRRLGKKFVCRNVEGGVGVWRIA